MDGGEDNRGIGRDIGRVKDRHTVSCACGSKQTKGCNAYQKAYSNFRQQDNVNGTVYCRFDSPAEYRSGLYWAKNSSRDFMMERLFMRAREGRT